MQNGVVAPFRRASRGAAVPGPRSAVAGAETTSRRWSFTRASVTAAR